jgi:hypothetical protein
MKQDFSDQILGESTEDTFKINSRDANAAAALELVKQAKRKLAIISQELDPKIYDQPDFLEVIRQMALKNRYVKIRIIVFEPELIVRRGHKLIDLAGKISTFIELRKVAPKYKTFNEAVLIADEVGYLYRESKERYKGKVNFNSPRESKHLLDVFEEMWETAKPDANLRKVHI